MSERKPLIDEKFVVKFQHFFQRTWRQNEQLIQSTKYNRCKRCSVLLLNIDSLLETETISLKALERQYKICKNKCRKRGIKTKRQNVKHSPASRPGSKGTTSSGVEVSAVVIKQEPLSPLSSPHETVNVATGALSELPGSDGTTDPPSDKQHPHENPVVEFKVELVDPAYEEHASKRTSVNKEGTDTKIRGVNKEFRIKAQPPCTATNDVFDTKATDLLRQAIAKTAIVEPTVFTRHFSTNTVTASTPVLQNVQSNMQTSVTSSVTSVSTQSSTWNGKNLPSLKNVNASKPVKQAKKSSKETTKIPISKISTPSTTSSPSVASVSSKEMSILQLMNGQLVLVPTDTMKNLCTKFPSLMTPTDASQNLVNLPSVVPSSGVAGTLPIISTVPQPTLSILPPTGPNLITPPVAPQLLNIPGQTNSNLQSFGNQLVMMPQTGNTNPTLLLQPGGNQPTNLFTMPNLPSVQTPNVPVVQQIAAPFIPALPTMQPSNENKKSENLSDTKAVTKTSFLRLADGQLVPIVSNPSSFSQTMSTSSSVMSKDIPKLSLAPNIASAIPCIAQSNGSPQLQYLVPAVPIPEKSSPNVMQSIPPTTINPSMNEKTTQGTTQFIQFSDGTLIPIASTTGQNQLPFQNNLLVGSANEKSNKKSLTEKQNHVPSPIPVTVSDLLKNRPNPSNVPQQIQSQNLPNNGISTFFVMDGCINNSSGANFQFHNSVYIPTSKESDVKTPDTAAKKQQPVILQSNRPKQWSENVGYNRPTQSRYTKKLNNIINTGAPKIKIAPNVLPVANPPQSSKSTGRGNSQRAPCKPSKRKPVNVVREEFDVNSKKRPRTYFTQEVIDVDEEPDTPPLDEDGRPKFMFMRNVKQPDYRPVLLDSTIEEKGLRIPDNMLL
ncbi:mucin-16-like [Saccostrea cucullata]|uniref:mucin-16-like n=1 Tax=Saccostrea cuccullata TaxID=36930 RepID=UPI002ED56D63